MNYDRAAENGMPESAASDGLDRREFSLMEHLSELRIRLMRAAAGVLLVSLGTFAVAAELLLILKRPVEAAARALDVTPRFVVISPAEYFIAELKAAVVLGVFLSMPWTLYQLWLFVAPGLYAKERRYVLTFVWAGAFFFLAGGAFAYFAVFPGMFEFFLRSTLNAGVEMTLSVAEHFSFSLKMLLAFGLAIQAPVIVYVLSMAGVVD
ncbi:MAG: twin-arginine translocase subunit TatC, partial [Myxococcota bacterium]